MLKKYIVLLALILIPTIKAQNFIESMRIEGNKITYHIHDQLHDQYLREDLFVEYPPNIKLHKLDYTILTMPLIMNTIGIIWVSGQDFYIDAMDRDLFESLEIVREIFRRFYPSTSFDGNLIPHKLVNNGKKLSRKRKAQGIALPFSHGLDSLCTSMRHRTTPQLLITARGMPDTPNEMWDINWETTQKTVKHFAKVHGHTTAFITSNFHDFFNWSTLCDISPEITHWRICTVESLGWMGLAAPILVSKGYRQFMLPANDDWESMHPGAGCPLVDETVRFAGITNICDGFDLPRLEKNRVIANMCNQHNIEKPYSMICERNLPERENCCECQKCVGSILSFLLIQEDPADHGFHIDVQAFLNYFKETFILENTYGPHALRTFQYCQKLAQENMNNLDPALQQFFAWYKEIDLTQYATPNPRIPLNYNDFVDLYDGIPEEVLKRHKAIN